jgi:hypothetical protein
MLSRIIKTLAKAREVGIPIVRMTGLTVPVWRRARPSASRSWYNRDRGTRPAQTPFRYYHGSAAPGETVLRRLPQRILGHAADGPSQRPPYRHDHYLR